MTTEQIEKQIELQKGLIDALHDKTTFILAHNDCLDISHLEDKSKNACKKGLPEAQDLLEQRIAYYEAMSSIYYYEGQTAMNQKTLDEIKGSTDLEKETKAIYKPLVESEKEWVQLLTKADKLMKAQQDKNEKRRILGLIQLAADVQKKGSFEEKMNAFIALENLK